MRFIGNVTQTEEIRNAQKVSSESLRELHYLGSYAVCDNIVRKDPCIKGSGSVRNGFISPKLQTRSERLHESSEL